MCESSDRLRPANRERVFVNCPFSQRNQAKFDAIIFALLYGKLTPIIAPHRKGSGHSRLDFIIRQIRTERRFSVHDITPVGGMNFRYNMAFELGMCVDAGHADNCLIFADNRRILAERFSDLAGLDIEEHGGKSENIARKIAHWLCKHFAEAPSPAKVEGAFFKFRAPFAVECHQHGWRAGDDLSIRVRLIAAWIRRHIQQDG